MSSERTTHNPSTQTLFSKPSLKYFQPAPGGGLEPMPVYFGQDEVTGEVVGPFLTRGACDWVLACIDNVRESQKFRLGSRKEVQS